MRPVAFIALLLLSGGCPTGRAPVDAAADLRADATMDYSGQDGPTVDRPQPDGPTLDALADQQADLAVDQSSDLACPGGCAPGQRCAGGACICDEASCSGCCDGVTCRSGDDDSACGVGGLSCATCGTDARCSAGSCAPCSKWTTTLATAPRLGIDADGTIYLASTTGNEVALTALDGCGRVLRSTTFTQSGWTTVISTTNPSVDGNALYVGGTVTTTAGQTDGMLARFDKSTLANTWAMNLAGQGKDELWSIAAGGGEIWLSGTQSLDTTPRRWGIKAAGGTGKACSFTIGDVGNGRGLALGGMVYLTGNEDGSASLSRLAPSCVVDPCSCSPGNWSLTWKDGSLFTDGRDLHISGSQVHVIGFSLISSTDARGFLTAFNPTTQQVDALSSWNPTTKGDLLTAIDGNATHLYIAGARGVTSLSTGDGVLFEVLASSPPATLPAGVAPGDVGYIAMALHPLGGLIVVSASGVIRRCSISPLSC